MDVEASETDQAGDRGEQQDRPRESKLGMLSACLSIGGLLSGIMVVVTSEVRLSYRPGEVPGWVEPVAWWAMILTLSLSPAGAALGALQFVRKSLGHSWSKVGFALGMGVSVPYLAHMLLDAVGIHI